MAENLKITIDLDVKGSADIKALNEKLKEIGGQAPKSSEGIKGLGEALRASASGAATFSGSLSKAAIEEASLAAKADALKAKLDALGKEMATGAKSADQAAKEFADFEKSVQMDGLPQATKEVGGLSGAIKGLVAGGILAAAGQQLLAFGKASIMAASDVEEMTSKFDTVFKSLSGDVTQELQAFADAANRSVYDLKGFAATLQDTFVPLGFARDEAADMSVQLVKLAEDLASFNNLNTADVVNDLQSALVGNTETLRKYGVVAQETQIKQEALRAGLWDGEGAISAQAKAQAILNLTIAGTADAQGDAIKTADSYANVSKGAEAAINDLQLAIGEGLIPAMTNLQGSTAETARALTGLIQIKNVLTAAVDAGVISQSDYLNMQLDAALSSKTLAEASEEVLAVMETLAAKTEGATKNQEKATAVTSELAAADAVLLGHINALNVAEANRIDGIIAYSAAAAEAAGVNEDLADKSAQLANHTGTAEQAAMAANLANERYFQTLEEEAEAARVAAEAQQALATATGDAFTAFTTATGPLGIFNETLDEVGTRMVMVGGRSAEQSADLERLGTAYDKAAQTVRDYELGIKGANLSDEARAEKIAEQQAIMAGLSESMQPLLSVAGEMVEVTGGLTVNSDALNNALYAAADAAGADAAELAILQVATGQMSEAQAEAVIKSVALEQTLNKLGEAYADGDLSLQDYITSAQQAVVDVNSMTVEFNTVTGAVANTSDNVGILVDTLGLIPASVESTVMVLGLDEAINKAGTLQQQLNGLGNQLSPGDAAGAGQKEGGGIYAAGGADFVVPPGYPNDSYGPLWVQSGEHVKVTPSGQTGGGTSNSVSIVQNFNGSSPNAMQDARNGTMQALREAGITGFG